MAGTFKIGTFNCHNLFSRARVLNREDATEGDAIMKKIADLYTEIHKDFYDNRQKIVDLFQDINTGKDGKPDSFIEIVNLRNTLISYSKKTKIWYVNPKVKGKPNWDGYISYKVSKFTKMARQNTARVITDIDADIISLMEIENKTVLDDFNSQLLFKTKTKKYEYSMCIDNVEDPRGIDVALLSRYPIVDIKTHMYDRPAGGGERIFSRDCLEITLELPPKGSTDYIYLFINHFKSQLGDEGKSDARRLAQTQRVADVILKERKFDLNKDKVVVMGDFNNESNNPTMAPVFNIAGLKDILEIKGVPVVDRWTYYYAAEKKYQQLDYILVSKPFWASNLVETGIQRKGIYNLETISGGKEKAWEEVQADKGIAAASDHAAIWAEFKL